MPEIERIRGNIRKSAPGGSQPKALSRMKGNSSSISRNNLELTPNKAVADTPIFLTSLNTPSALTSQPRRKLLPNGIRNKSIGRTLDEVVEAEELRAKKEKERFKQEMLKKIKMKEERNLQNEYLKERMEHHSEIMQKRGNEFVTPPSPSANAASEYLGAQGWD